jgi:hypothetical protein
LFSRRNPKEQSKYNLRRCYLGPSHCGLISVGNRILRPINTISENIQDSVQKLNLFFLFFLFFFGGGRERERENTHDPQATAENIMKTVKCIN